MKIGILNAMMSDINLNTHFTGSTLPLTPENPGDPLNEVPVSFSWLQIRDQQISLELRLPQKAFVDTLVLETGKDTALTSAVLTDGSQILYQHHAETGETVTSGTITLEAGIATDRLEVQLECFFSGITVNKLSLYGAVEDGIDLFPIPHKAASSGKSVPATAFATYSGSEQAGSILAEKFAEKTGVMLAFASQGDIRFVTDPTIATDGYTLDIQPGRAVITASNLRGMVSGAETFIKLTGKDSVQCATISDYPDRPFRGVHLFLPGLADMVFAKRLIKYLISPMGYNTVILEVAAGMRFDSHPEINASFLEAIEKSGRGEWPLFPHNQVSGGGVLEKDAVREYVAYIRSFGIEPLPEIQSLGHVQYMTLPHPEIAELEYEDFSKEIDTRGEDARPPEFYPHCYCPSNEKSYEILFDSMDEIIEGFNPKEYVHMGHDEVYQIGICPKCAKKDPAQLYADDVTKIHDYLAAKGLKMMIWSDMIQPCTLYKTPPAIDKIPKDIVMLDFIWYFHFDKDIEDNLLAKDFKVAVGNLYSSHYPRFESRLAKKNMLGGQISMWVGTNESDLQQEGKFFDIFLTANMLWNADSYDHRHNRLYDRMISARMPQLREDLRHVKYPSRIEGAKTTVLIENPITFPPADPKQQTEFAVTVPCDSLVLYHTCLRKLTRAPWAKHDVVGNYLLTFDDGSTMQIPITANGNIGYWNRRQNQILKHPLYRHNGYTAGYYTDGIERKTTDGSDVTIYRLEELLPDGKQLISVALQEDPALDAKIFLCGAEGVTCY